ncbi:hypothetical protein [Bacillus xiapuensis]|uniref:DUF3886 domain-containing protein n=1 Tax=Bacillus xiapuensis TaxID=2014075 RepID=A0ABU6NDD4_9BACI|nr:hypothetical protein [Bacillus xiapuensis]
MKLIDQLSKEQIRQLNKLKEQLPKKKQKKKKREQEKVNWEDLMGMNRDIYTRRNGAVRRK